MAFGTHTDIRQVGINLIPRANSVDIHHLLDDYFFYTLDVHFEIIPRSEVLINFLLRPFIMYMFQNNLNKCESNQILMDAWGRFLNKYKDVLVNTRML
jgi:hypothetical protein